MNREKRVRRPRKKTEMKYLLTLALAVVTLYVFGRLWPVDDAKSILVFVYSMTFLILFTVAAFMWANGVSPMDTEE